MEYSFCVKGGYDLSFEVITKHYISFIPQQIGNTDGMRVFVFTIAIF